MTRSIACRIRFGFLLLALLGPAVFVFPTSASVYVNEVAIRGVERIEIYNSGPSNVDLSGWTIQGSDGGFVIPDSTVIGVGQYLVLDDLGGIFDNIGGETSLIDLTNTVEDQMYYGDQGGAPLPHDDSDSDVSLARAPDGSANPPLNPANDALFWTIDFSQTFGVMNDAPPPALGGPVYINEIDVAEALDDTVEFYNGTALAIDIPLSGWILTDGTTAAPLTGVVPSGGVLALSLPTSIETAQVAYLFDPAGVRIDQVGFAGAPLPRLEGCIGRCPDGAGPNNGFNYETSGGGLTWRVMTCTMDELNETAPQCGGTDTQRSSWGRLKGFFFK